MEMEYLRSLRVDVMCRGRPGEAGAVASRVSRALPPPGPGPSLPSACPPSAAVSPVTGK